MAAHRALPDSRDVIRLPSGGWGPAHPALDEGPGEQAPEASERERLVEELQRTRLALARSEARYHMLSEQAPVMMHSIDRHGRICSVSDLWLITLGYRRDEVIGRPSIDFLTEESRRYALETVLPEYMRTGYCRDIPYQFVKQSGEVIDVLLSATAERGAQDEVLRSIAILVDVTERNRAEAERKFTEARLRALADNSPLVIFMKDIAGRYVVANREFQRRHGKSASELVGKTTFDLFPAADAATYVQQDREVIETGNVVVREFVDRETGEIWSALKFPIVNSAGTTIGVGCIETNVTDQKRAEDTLRVAKEQAETASRTKSTFLANMSHELRTPLNAILGFSEIMREQMFGPLGSPRYLDYANDIYQSGSLLLELISDILDLSKIEAGRLELHEETLDIAELVEGALVFTRDRASGNGIAIECRLAPDLPLLRADPRQLTQILLNLLSNAVKFTPSGGRITVAAGIDAGGDLVIRVTDTGIGIAAADIAKALQAFVQVENAMSRKHSGTGLGLPLSKGLAELHGGRLEISSEPGAGTTVAVHLPAARLVQRPPEQ